MYMYSSLIVMCDSIVIVRATLHTVMRTPVTIIITPCDTRTCIYMHYDIVLKVMDTKN